MSDDGANSSRIVDSRGRGRVVGHGTPNTSGSRPKLQHPRRSHEMARPLDLLCAHLPVTREKEL